MRRLVVLAVVGTVLAGLAPATAPAAAAAPPPALTWGECPPPAPAFPRDPRQECAALRVPVDYRNPGGRQLTITVSRIPATSSALRRGILLSNPGGPGGSGLDLPSYFALTLPAEVQARYDLIGFDPRGVGASTPITCGLPADTPPDLVLPYPAPDGSIAANVAFARSTARSCAEHTGGLLRFVTTANTARDMDRIRAALGEPKLSYLGYSYGTYLGAVYASLFPQRGDRLILDSAVDPDRIWYDTWRLFAPAVALRLPDFTTWAAARDAVYHLGSTPAAVRRTYDRLAAELDREPVILPGLVVNGNVFREITRASLYDDRLFPSLAENWQAADELRTVMLPTQTTSPAEVPVDNQLAVLYAIACNDIAWQRDVDRYAGRVAVDRRLFPVTAGMPANVWPCVFWPHAPIEPQVRVTGNGPRNVLILQNLRDPATPWVTGFGMRTALGNRAALVTVDAGGHGIYAIRSGPCTDAIATAFLVDGVLPAHDRFCVGPSPDDITTETTVPWRPGRVLYSDVAGGSYFGW